MSNNLKIKIFWFVQKNYYTKGLFISNLVFKKKEKKEKQKKIVLLKTQRYVVFMNELDDKKKIVPLKLKLGLSFDKFLKNLSKSTYFYSNFELLYSNLIENSLLEIAKYKNPFYIKFDVLNIFHIFFRLFLEKPFSTNFWATYFTTKRFELYSLFFTNNFFLRFENPNKPLKWSKKEKTLTIKKQYIFYQIKKYILKQLVYQWLGVNYSFNSKELNDFKILKINPNDGNFYWPTRRLFLIGLSEHDGWIWSNNTAYYSSLDNLPTLDPPTTEDLNIKFAIMKQLVFWWYKLLSFLKNHLLISDFTCMWNLPQINNFFSLYWKDLKTNYYYYDFITPKFYIGTVWELLGSNFFFDKEHLTWDELTILNNFRSSSVNKKFFQKFPVRTIYETSDDYKNVLENVYFIKFGKNGCYTIFDKNKKIKNLFFLNVDKRFADLTVEGFFKWHKRLYNKYYDPTLDKISIIQLPGFLRNLYSFLNNMNMSDKLLDEYCTTNFYEPLVNFLNEKKKISKIFYWNLQDLALYKNYTDNYFVFKNPVTDHYKMFISNLRKYVNKDDNVKIYEPFGLNPFFKTLKYLDKTKVPFPEAVNFETSFKTSLSFKKTSFFYWLPTELSNLNLQVSSLRMGAFGMRFKKWILNKNLKTICLKKKDVLLDEKNLNKYFVWRLKKKSKLSRIVFLNKLIFSKSIYFKNLIKFNSLNSILFYNTYFNFFKVTSFNQLLYPTVNTIFFITSYSKVINLYHLKLFKIKLL